MHVNDTHATGFHVLFDKMHNGQILLDWFIAFLWNSELLFWAISTNPFSLLLFLSLFLLFFSFCMLFHFILFLFFLLFIWDTVLLSLYCPGWARTCDLHQCSDYRCVPPSLILKCHYFKEIFKTFKSDDFYLNLNLLNNM